MPHVRRGPEPAAAPGILGGAPAGGRHRRLPFPCEAFTSLQGGTNQPRARPGRRGTAGSLSRVGIPCCWRAHSSTEEGALSAPSEPQAPGPLSPKRLARISAPQFAPYKLYELSHFTYFGPDFVFFRDFFKVASLQDRYRLPTGREHTLETRGPNSQSTETF